MTPTELQDHWRAVERRLHDQIDQRVPADHQAEAHAKATAMLDEVRGAPLLTRDQAVALMQSRGYSHWLAGDGRVYPIHEWNPYGLPGESYFGFAVPDAPNTIEDARYSVQADAHGVPCLFGGRWTFLTTRDLCATCGAVLQPDNLWNVRGMEAALGPFCSEDCATHAATAASQGRGAHGRRPAVYRDETDAELQRKTGLGGA